MTLNKNLIYEWHTFSCTIYEICQTYTTYYKENRIMIFFIYFSFYIVLLTYWYKSSLFKNIQLDSKTFQTNIKSSVYNSVKSNTQKQVQTLFLLRKFTYSANVCWARQVSQKMPFASHFPYFHSWCFVYLNKVHILVAWES